MTFDLPTNFPPEIYPLVWLVGTWRGSGTIGYHDLISPGNVISELVFTADAGPYLSYQATTWLTPDQAADADSSQITSSSVGNDLVWWHSETGYWRIPPGQADDSGQPRQVPPFEVEVLTADPAGYVTVYLGEVNGPRITVASDLLARTASAVEITASRRLYGLVDGDLLWAWDMAAFGHPLGSYLAARLQKYD